MLTTIVIFIIVLGILVLVHEFGHFIVAKKTGMRVEEFGFGFPPRVFGIQKQNGKFRLVLGHKQPNEQEVGEQETIYSINWIPFGGFVKIMGENNDTETDTRSFVNRPFWARLATLVAGVFMNWLLAFVIFTVIFMTGSLVEINSESQYLKNAKISSPQILIPQVQEDSPASKAGIKEGDVILSIDNKVFQDSSEVKTYINANKGKEFVFNIKRQDNQTKVNVKSELEPKPGKGATGIAIIDVAYAKIPFFTSIKLSFLKTVALTEIIFKGIYGLFVSKEVLSSVGGPVKIAQMTGEFYRLGLSELANFVGALSVNLAVLNILPIPALDGGRVLFLIIEKIRGKKNNQKFEQITNSIAFLVLISLMVLVTIKDIVHK